MIAPQSPLPTVLDALSAVAAAATHEYAQFVESIARDQETDLAAALLCARNCGRTPAELKADVEDLRNKLILAAEWQAAHDPAELERLKARVRAANQDEAAVRKRQLQLDRELKAAMDARAAAHQALVAYNNRRAASERAGDGGARVFRSQPGVVECGLTSSHLDRDGHTYPPGHRPQRAVETD